MASKVVESAAKPPNAGKGRKKGVPNKTTKAIKDAITEAFDRAGGVDYLVRLADTDPKTFCALVGKVIPLQVEGTGENGEVVFRTIYESRR